MPDIGLSPLSEAPSLEGMDSEERVDAMVAWFYENFEDPANETPYESAEGGYLYIHGGPYEAEDYIPDHFPDATEEEVTEAIDRLNGDGPEFAPAGHRVLPPEEDDEPYEVPPLSVRLEALSGQLEEIRGHVTEMLALQRREREEREGPPPPGHNNPPPDAEPDLYEVLDSVREVEGELAKPGREDAADPIVLERAEGRFNRFLSWLRDLGGEAPKKFVLGAIGAAGGVIGKAAMDYALNHQAEIIASCQAAAGTVSHWLMMVSVPF